MKRRNRVYLRRVFTVKALFYPLLRLISSVGLARPLEPVLNRLVRAVGINKNVRYFFKYRDFARWFRNYFVNMPVGRKEVLFPMITGVHSNFTMVNLMLARWFGMDENMNPVFYVCNSAFDICTKDGMLKSRDKYPWFCHECWKGYKHIETATGIPVVWMNDMADGGDEDLIRALAETETLTSVDDCTRFEYKGMPAGRYARRSTLRYFLTGNLEEDENTLEIFRKYLRATLTYSYAMRRLLDSRPAVTHMVIINGSLCFEAAARYICDERGIDYMTLETYIGSNSLIYKKNGPVMELDWNKEYEKFIKYYSLTDEVRLKVDSFFSDLRKGVEMYAVLNREHDAGRLAGAGKYVCLFTNLNFDTAVIDRNLLFESMEHWIFSVISYWNQHKPPVSLVIRVHPGEIKLVTASREFLGERIRRASEGNERIMVIDSDEQVNSYELIEGMEFGMIYSSTIGMEMTLMGKTCLVAGMPWFRSKPFVIWPPSRDEYFSELGRMVEGSYNFTPDIGELYRTVWFVYFNRVKRLNGLKVYTPQEEQNSLFGSGDEMVSANEGFLKDFSDEFFRQ